MKTIGFHFLNDEVLQHKIVPFSSIEDIMFNRRINSGKNKSNNSTYITKSTVSNYDIYGKTYGANKYETSLICYALSMLAKREQRITLYEVLEHDLKELPKSSLNVINGMGVIRVVPTDLQLEKKAFEENNSLRSPRYIYNLLNKLGKKHCAMCGCEIPEIIQGAHIWPVALGIFHLKINFNTLQTVIMVYGYAKIIINYLIRTLFRLRIQVISPSANL